MDNNKHRLDWQKKKSEKLRGEFDGNKGGSDSGSNETSSGNSGRTGDKSSSSPSINLK
ncbi:MAG: hypothetical protein HY370_09030 [Proteobacteria bacterium]|nr:hypothetical protein [Pseudomonadota bacterium]